MAGFLSKIIADIVEGENLTLTEESTAEENVVILNFLDHLFSLLPTTVSKCWTKFNEYFEFWYELSKRGPSLILYMQRKEVVKHFMDYFLDKKSPLKIYAKKR